MVSQIGRLVVASHNPGKVEEIAALLAPFGIDAISAGALGLPEPEETEPTFVGNARLKAEAAARASGLAALADDSGLEVAALGGAPGVLSARWAEPTTGAGRDFAAAMRRVWTELAGAPDRSARFVCVLALARPGEETYIFEGEVRGHIVWPPRGEHGFGYDPIFMAEGYDITFGEMAPEEKHKISHRARAFARFVDALR